MTRRTTFATILIAAMATAAEAHTGIGSTAGFAHGLSHPFSGLDHILAMVAVGLFSANLGGRAMWLVPGAFMTMMAAGGAAGIAGFGLPFVEVGIAMSVIVLGTAVALQWKAPSAAAMGLAGFFAIFHGYAHGAEMPVDASGMSYGLGFVLATLALHALGIGAGLGVASGSRRIAQAGGAAMAFAGAGLLTGIL